MKRWKKSTIIKIHRIMKDLIKIMRDDFEAEGFTRTEWVIYGLIVPVCFVIGCLIGGALG